MTIEIILNEEVDLKGRTLITGFHGIGVVGYIAVKYMIEQTNARKIGLIISKLTPPLISLNEEGTIQLPFEIYLDEENNFVYLLIRFQPHPEELRDFTKQLAIFAQEMNLKDIILLGGLDGSAVNGTFDPEEDEKGFRCVITNNFPFDDPPLIDAGLFISGGIAMLLIELELRKIPALTLFPFAERDHPDMHAATKAIQIINELCETNIKTDDLKEEAKDLENEVNQILRQEVKKDPNHFYT